MPSRRNMNHKYRPANVVQEYIVRAFDYLSLYRTLPEIFCNLMEGEESEDSKGKPNQEPGIVQTVVDRTSSWFLSTYEAVLYGSCLFNIGFFAFGFPALNMIFNILFTAWRAQKYGFLIDYIVLGVFLAIGMAHAFYLIYIKVYRYMDQWKKSLQCHVHNHDA